MAQIVIDGLDQVMGELNARASALRPIIEEALRRSADVLREELLAQERKFKAPTGELGRTITASLVGHAQGASMIDVYYAGDGYFGARGGGEKKGETAPRRAAFVATMQENKNRNPFNARARKIAQPRINTIVEEMLAGGQASIKKGEGGL